MSHAHLSYDRGSEPLTGAAAISMMPPQDDDASVWLGVGFILAVSWWVIAIWLAATVAVGVWWAGVPGLAAACWGVVALRRLAHQSWNAAFFWAGSMVFVLTFVIFFSLVSVY